MAEIQKGKRLVNAEILGKVAEGLKKYTDQAEADAKSAASSALGTAKTELTSAIGTAKSEAIADAAKKDAALKTELTTAIGTAKSEAIADAASKDTALKTELQGNIDKVAGDVADIQTALGATGDKSIKDQLAEIVAKDTAQDGRLDVLQGTGEGSVKKALEDAKSYADQKDTALKTELQNKINTDVKAEKDRAEGVEAELQGSIEAIQTAIDSIVTLDEDGNVTGGLIDGINEAIDSANQSRLDGDNALQQKIDAINNGTNGILAQAKAYTDQEVGTEKQRAMAAEAKALSDAKAYADQQITALVDSAPDAMNTLNELAEAIKGNKDIYDGWVTTHEAAMAKMKTDLQAEIDTDVTVEANRAKGEEAKIRSEFAAADTALHTTITGETAAAVKAEADRAKAEEADIRADFVAADAALKTELQGKINTDVKAVADELAKQKDAAQSGTLANQIKVEKERALAAEQGLDGRLDSLEAAMGETGSVAQAIEAAVSAEATARQNADATLKSDLQKEIDADVKVEKERAEGVEADIRSEFAAADTELSGRIDDHDLALEAIGSWYNEETGKGTGIFGTIKEYVDKETQRATSAEGTLQTNISNEASARQQADTNLQTAINTINGTGAGSISKAVADEATLRSQADQNLQNSINAINNANTGILKQAKDYTDGLQAKVVNTFNALNLEFVEQADGQPAIQVTLDSDGELGTSPLSGKVKIPVMTDGEVSDMLVALGLN